ncbi:MAG: ribose 5-phosphate isomerase B [Deltaproteobacteria bacterium]|nr:ribose 5-phosphate isomerase B [Deltaproteobacteria bacterium]
MTAKRKLAIASDHAGFILKEFLKSNLSDVEWIDKGPASTDRVDYPDYAVKVASAVVDGTVELGVLVCGSGIGMCISANKINGIRAAVVESETSARLSRAHNDANVLCIGARLIAPDYAKDIVQTWLKTPFEGGRHADRVRKITNLEKK